eukprot:gene1173-1280_t
MAPTKFLVVRYSKTLEFRKPEKCVVIAAAPAPEHCCGDFLGLRSILAAVRLVTSWRFPSLAMQRSQASIALKMSDSTSCECADMEGTVDSPLFKIAPTSEVTLDEISDANLVLIVNRVASDRQCNQLLWKCLGYQYDSASDTYKNENVFPRWRQRFPTPPDVIGVKRVYMPEIDRPVRDASVALMRSIPPTFKGGVRALVAHGFVPYKVSELTPNKTRRAQLANWLLYYREQLFGRSLEELERDSPPIENLDSESQPSARMYQINRIV